MFEPIAITGAAAVCALGESLEAALPRLRAGESGVRGTAFGSQPPVHFGAMPDLEPPPWADRWPTYAAAIRQDRGLVAGLHTADAAWAQSGLGNAPPLPHRGAVVLGSSRGHLPSLLTFEAAVRRGGAADASVFRLFSGESLGSMAAVALGLTGPVLNYPAACATGLTCLAAAVRLLQDGMADAVLAGSVEASTNELTLASYRNLGVLHTGRAIPFSRQRRGFNLGEGAAALVLERATDAEARGAQVRAVIRGIDFRSDAHHMTALDPDGRVMALSVRTVMEQAGWSPQNIGYVNAHGTATVLNDATEARVLDAVFGPSRPPVSSLKAAIGHLLGASSSVETALALAALESGFLPVTAYLDDPDPVLPLHHATPEDPAPQPCRWLKLSAGFGGHLGAIALETPAPASGR